MKLLYFARLRETLGCPQETLTLPTEIHDIAALKLWLAARGGPWQVLVTDPSLRAAVNQTLAQDHSPVQDRDEIAFFPPVTGG